MTASYNQELQVELIEKEILAVELKTIDIIKDSSVFTENLADYIIDNEEPIQLNATTFKTANDYIANNLVVYFNGIKEKYINKLSDNTFSFNIAIITDDKIEVSYIKKA